LKENGIENELVKDNKTSALEVEKIIEFIGLLKTL